MMESIQPVTCLALIHFEGPDARKFLQGYLTCDTTKLVADVWVPGAFCDLKGRVVASGWVVATDAGIDCLVHRGLAETLLQFLKIYLRLSKTKARLHNTTALAVTFAGAGAHIAAVQVLDDAADALAADPFVEALNQRSFVLVNPETTGRFLPQALGLVDAGAVSFDKGCYLGQEIVARAEHRGNVKKNLVRLRLNQNVSAQPLAIVNDSNRQKIGAIVQPGIHTALMVADSPIEDDTRCYIDETEVTPDDH